MGRIMPDRGPGFNRSFWDHTEERAAQYSSKAARGKFRFARHDLLLKARRSLAEPRADAANEEIANDSRGMIAFYS
jgi:hypothetical protein